MSLARALTSRRKEELAPQPSYVGRAASQRVNATPIKRSEISLPVALLSTTNMLSYEAPDIVDSPHVSHLRGRYLGSNKSIGSPSPSMSGEDSDLTGSIHSRDTDATSVEMSSPDLAEANHLDQYFKSPNPQRSPTTSRISRSTTHSSQPSMGPTSPKVPSRAPSHNKTAHILSHKLSVQRTAATSPQVGHTRDSFDMFNVNAVNRLSPAPVVAHPFGKELAQLNEAAEEFGHAVRNAEADADTQIMHSKGLVRFCADDYMTEISSFYSNAFEEDAAAYQPMAWI